MYLIQNKYVRGEENIGIIRRFVLLPVLTVAILTLSFVVYAIDFDAERSFESVFVVVSGNALGSGFAIGETCVVTNAHVIKDDNSVKITTYGGKEYTAEVYRKSTDLDIAVLVVPGGSFKALKIGNKTDVTIGEDVYAIGAPNGMSYTLTKGTLSSNKRIINGEEYLQIDAAINEGNSGGPLLNKNGSVIGMNTMKVKNSEGLGLSIPIGKIISYLKSVGISVSDDGSVFVLNMNTQSEDETTVQPSKNADSNLQSTENTGISIIIVVLCASIIINIVLIIMLLRYKSKLKTIINERREYTDFEIDFWE